MTARALALAGDRYAGYPCDVCDQPIGADGVVELTTEQPRLVWACRCPACEEAPQDRMYTNDEARPASTLLGRGGGPPQDQVSIDGERAW